MLDELIRTFAQGGPLAGWVTAALLIAVVIHLYRENCHLHDEMRAILDKQLERTEVRVLRLAGLASKWADLMERMGINSVNNTRGH